VGQLLENRRLSRRIATLEAQRELARMQDEFISTISHELRTPLGFIKGYVTTLLREDIQWEESRRQEFLRIIDDEADRLRELIDNLLDSSRLESGTLSMTLEPTRLPPIIRDVVKRVQGAHPDMQIAVDIPEEKFPILRLDSTRIAQVLDNFLNNARKYAPESHVEVRIRRQERNILVEVEDQGPGIAPEHLSHLFERFYRVTNDQSIRGTGSTSPYPSPISVSKGRRETMPDQKTVLVVDDEPRYLGLVQINLETDGYNVITAMDGQQAVEAVAHNKPDIVLLDVMMPVMDGFTACERIREFSSVPIIILTAKGEERDRVRGLDAGADDYIVKPFSAQELLARGGKEVSLTATEYRLLQTMASNLGHVLSSEELLTSVWGPEYKDDKEILWVCLSRLRQKIEADPKNPIHIVTRQGIGYLMPPAEEAA